MIGLALDHRGVIPLAETILSTALLRARQGRLREARALYELAWQQPRFHNYVLYDNIYGKNIRELTAEIPEEEPQEIVGETAEMDIWQAGAELLEELLAAEQDGG